MIPFRLSFTPGVSLYEQVVCAAKKAVVSGQMRPGDPFPSVRVLSKALKIIPNTAHKVVTHLVAEGLLEVHSGIGTVVAKKALSRAADRGNLLNKELERPGRLGNYRHRAAAQHRWWTNVVRARVYR